MPLDGLNPLSPPPTGPGTVLSSPTGPGAASLSRPAGPGVAAVAPRQGGRRGGRRRAGPGGMRRAGRLRELLVSGIVDSFGMALGWTVVVLLATARGGLAEAALYNAAMLGGVVLSAPVTGWLSRRLNGRTLLRGAAAVEALLRFAVLGGLVAGAPPAVVAAGIVVMHVAAWAGFAGMRAEVSAIDASPRSMTRYAVCIAGVEAAGTALAALLPNGPDGYPTGWLLHAVFLVYVGSLLPTVLTARRARIAAGRAVLTRPRAKAPPLGTGSALSNPALSSPALSSPALSSPAHSSAAPGSPALGTGPALGALPSSADRPAPGARFRHSRPRPFPLPSPRLLAAGGSVMLLASGPALLAIPVTEQLHGDGWVAGAAVAFSLGCLLSTTAVEWIGKLRLPVVLRWSLWGLGMLAGWILAPAFAPMVLVAQFLAGLSQTAFEGDMDARVAADASPESVTRHLAYAASVRALGGAIAVRTMPMLVAASAIGAVASAASLVLGITAVVVWAGLTTAPHVFRRLAH
ncbi:hypothetical protein ACIA5D_26145 [Actinoplanes sp. NPDC051513]|uniref:hypothetical protein n=1 Tax=Actinoplanes sp. NPDC051513 TaxID=3363908 RepID=UPI003791E746